MAKIPDQTPQAPTAVSPKKIKKDFSTDNASALRIALDDARADEKFISEKMWALRWREIDSLPITKAHFDVGRFFCTGSKRSVFFSSKAY